MCSKTTLVILVDIVPKKPLIIQQIPGIMCFRIRYITFLSVAVQITYNLHQNGKGQGLNNQCSLPINEIYRYKARDFENSNAKD